MGQKGQLGGNKNWLYIAWLSRLLPTCDILSGEDGIRIRNHWQIENPTALKVLVQGKVTQNGQFLCPAKRTKMSKPRQKSCVFRTFLLLKASWCRAQLSKAGAREELDAFTRSLSWSRYLWSLAYCNRPHETLCGLLVCVGSRTHVLSSNQNLRQFWRQDVLVCQLYDWHVFPARGPTSVSLGKRSLGGQVGSLQLKSSKMRPCHFLLPPLSLSKI